jgi:branched-chain amino acid transport system substrate-binding protein
MNRMTKKLGILACLALLAGACGGGSDSVQKASASAKQDIKLGAVFDLSGPTADIGVPFSEGIRDYVDWRNTHGGVEGHKIDLVWQDFSYKVPQAEQLYSQFVSEGAVAFMGWGTADTEALRPRITTDRIPFMSASYGATLADPAVTPYNFFPGVDYSEQMRIVLKYISEQSQGQHVEVAVFHHDSPFGTSPLEAGKKYIADKSLDIGFKTYAMPAGAVDHLAQLGQAKAQGASYIVIQHPSTGAAKLATNVAAARSTAQIICLNYCGDELYIKLAGPASDKSLAVMPFAPPSAADLAGMKDLSDYLKGKNATVEAKGLRYVQGWFTTSAMAEGMKNGLRHAGNRKLDGQAIKAGLEEIAGFETGGVSEPITFSTTSHAGLKAAPLYQVKDGKWTKLTGLLKS